MATSRGRVATAIAPSASSDGSRGRGSHFNPDDRPVREPGNGNNRPVDRHPNFVKVTGRTVAAIAIVLLALVAAWTPMAPSLVEDWFSTSTYPVIQRTVTPLSNYAPVALLDILIIAAVLAIAVAFTHAVRTA